MNGAAFEWVERWGQGRALGARMGSCVFLVVLCCLTAAAPVWAATVTFEPIGDNWISSCSSGCSVNNGGMDELRIRSSWWGSPGNREPKNFRSLLSFDLGSLPANEDLITGATLGLYYFSKPHDNPAGRTYQVHRMTNSWDELGSTWQARDDYDEPTPFYWDSYHAGVPAYQPGGGDFASPAYASAVIPADVGRWVTWDVADLAKEWVAGTHDNVGLLIKDAVEIELDPGGGAVSYLARFRSGEYDDPAYRPCLEVTYVPGPSTLGLLGLGTTLLLRRRSTG